MLLLQSLWGKSLNYTTNNDIHRILCDVYLNWEHHLLSWLSKVGHSRLWLCFDVQSFTKLPLSIYYYSRTFSRDKIFTKSSSFCIVKILIFVNESRWQNWRNFLLVKISGCTLFSCISRWPRLLLISWSWTVLKPQTHRSVWISQHLPLSRLHWQEPPWNSSSLWLTYAKLNLSYHS